MLDPRDGSVITDHAETMDRQYRFQRHIYDLTRKYYLLGRDRLLKELFPAPGQSVLEVGCGTGRNIEHMMRLYPQARYFGLDIAKSMLETAEKRFTRKSGNRPHLRVGDATVFTAGEFGESGFDRIVISYAVSMIPGWESAIQRSLDALNPGGSLHIVDFGQQERLPSWFRSLLFSWLHRFHVAPRPNLFEVVEVSANQHGATAETEAPFGGYAWITVVKMPG